MLQMLQRLAEGLSVEHAQIEAHRQLTPPPLPADLLAGAAAQARLEQVQQQPADGADTVRPRQSSQVGGWVVPCCPLEPTTSIPVCLPQPSQHSSTQLTAPHPLLLAMLCAGCGGQQQHSGIQPAGGGIRRFCGIRRQAGRPC